MSDNIELSNAFLKEISIAKAREKMMCFSGLCDDVETPRGIPKSLVADSFCHDSI